MENSEVSDDVDVVSTASVGDTFTDNYLTYKIINNDMSNLQVEVIGYIKRFPNPITNIDIPSTVSDGTYEYTVVSIGENTFNKIYDLTDITIPDSVISIESGAFVDCSNLTSVTILNDNIKLLYRPYSAGGVFEDCSNLYSLQIAISENINSTPTIEYYCFMSCPDDRSLTFLTEDGTTKLSNSTTPTLAEAVKAYNAVDDGGIGDGYWYGWKLPKVNEVPDTEETFTITPKDGYRISSILADGNEVLNSEQVTYYSETESPDAGNTKAGSSTEYYVFENVTGNHTLAAYFEAINTGDNNDPDDSSDDKNNDASNSDGSSDNDTSNNNGDNNSGSNYTDNNNSFNVSSSNDTGINNPVAISDPSEINSSDDFEGDNTPAPASKDSEPKTGDASHIEVYAAIAMIA